MKGSIFNFYAGGNTAQGYANLFDSSFQALERVFLLEGVAGTGKSINICSIGNQLAEEGYSIWMIHCSSDNDALDGIIIPALKLGIIDGTSPHISVPELSDVELVHANLREACHEERLESQRSEIERLNEEISQAYELAYSGFAEALRVHDDWEKLYITNMDFQAADELTKEMIENLYSDRQIEKLSRVDHRFLGAATPRGAIDFVPNLSDGLKRYLIKGRPGSGKSTMLKKLAAVAVDRGFDVEIYHCGFDPNSLDMVIVRELGFAIFDSTAPHEYYPDRPSDEIVDMYERCIKPGTDEQYSEAISLIKERYSSTMKQSTQYLARARSLLDELEQIHIQSTDLSILEGIAEEIKQRITVTN
ncbi:PRK06851 family protein [Cohnella sp. WQ 127256]|uniref:PRK06851 family protein n=1 Tax=Cohnella sp. WQ 127256 TaxID=2938790 RepID=UPI002117352F|nr:PRK06851 family protein [Cohnella sp. WQ 127256]